MFLNDSVLSSINIKSEAGQEKVNFLFYHMGVNDIQHSLVEEIPVEKRIGDCNKTYSAIDGFIEHSKLLFPDAKRVYLGTTGQRRNRMIGKNGIYSEKTTASMLRAHNRDISEVAEKACKRTVESGGFYYNACRGLRDCNIRDKHGHVTGDFLGHVVIGLAMHLYNEFDIL